jgi:hypothetical protein
MKLKVHNPDNLPTMSYQDMQDFQGDLKEPIAPDALEKLKNDLIKHGLFVPKFVWFDGETPKILDGHQTKQALDSLEQDGYEVPSIPYVTVEAIDQKDAAEKLLQLNSQYGKINPFTSWFDELQIGGDDLEVLLESVEMPTLDISNLGQPDFEPATEDEQGRLDELDPIIVTCPNCHEEFDVRKQS